MPLPGDLLVRLAHRDRVDDTGEIADGVAYRPRVAAEHTDRKPIGAGQLDRLEAALADMLDDVGDLVASRLNVHEHQHRLILREAGVTPTSSCSGPRSGRRHRSHRRG